MNLVLGPYGDAVEQRIERLRAAGAADRIGRRDPSFWSADAVTQGLVANRLGWLDIASRIHAALPELDAFARDVRDAGFTSVVLLGMGGSSLAPEVLRQSLPPREDAPAFFVLDTTGPTTIATVTSRIDLARTLFFVSSKSGTTIEALTLFEYFYHLVAARKRERAGENFVAVTDAGTPLQDLASTRSFRRVFTNPSDIGGRYSALSYFGLAPAAAAGIDVRKLLGRAVAAEEAVRCGSEDALRLGALLGELALHRRDKVTFLLGPEIGAFGLWVEQLIAESTGKLGRGIVPVAGEPPGSPLKYSDDRLFIQMRVEGGYTAEIDAVIGAVTAEGFPAVVIDLEDAYDLGREFYVWEYATAVAGTVLEIDPFDEPNVQESKDNTSRVLGEFERTGRLDVPGLPESGIVAVTEAGVSDARPALAELLQALQPRGYFAITAFLPQTVATEIIFADIRTLVRDALRVATTLGYGPRYLHSTGQLHKGGLPAGVFLQLTADAGDVPIPGRPYTFGRLHRAQAIGDIQALRAHGRPALRIHLGRDVERGLVRLRDLFRELLAPSHLRR